MDRAEMEKLQNEIRDALTRAREQFTSFGSKIANKDVIIFLGNTRSGKSTVINYLLGTKLQAFKIIHDYKIKKADETADGPQIGQGSKSETAIPGVHQTSSQSDKVYVDAPGFGDNRGDAQEIINAIFVNQIRLARTCKFVLITDINDIQHDNVKGFLNFVKNIHDLIPTSALRNSLSLVITKADTDWTPGEIGELLDEKILQSGLTTRGEVKELVGHFVQQHQLIALFLKPTHEGEITSKIDVNIEGAISNCLPLAMNTVPVRFAISDEVRLALLEIYQNFGDELQFNDELNEGIAEYRNYFVVSDYVFASTEEELDETHSVMIEWKGNLTNAKNINQLNVQKLLDSITALIDPDTSKEFYKTLTLFAMLENVELLQESFRNSLIKKYKDSLEDTIGETDGLISKINAEQTERKKLDIIFNLSVVGAAGVVGVAAARVVTGAAAVAGVAEAAATTAGAIAANTAAVGAAGGALETVAAGIAGAASNVAAGGAALTASLGLLTGVGAAAAVGVSMLLYNMRNDQIERRKIARQRQGR